MKALIQNPLLEVAIAHYGPAAQIDQTLEELAELTLAIHHGRKNGYQAVVEELADVLIMCAQLRLMVGARDVDEMIERKLERLKLRMINEELGELPPGYTVDQDGRTWKWTFHRDEKFRAGEVKIPTREEAIAAAWKHWRGEGCGR